MKLIDLWHKELWRLWSIRVGLFFGAFNGFMIGVAAFSGELNPVFFLTINVIGWSLLIGARLLHQPGANPDQAGVEK